MKRVINFYPLLLALVTGFFACDKAGDLPYYKNGTPVSLSSSAADIAPLEANAADTAITYSWSNPKYGTDSSNVKYVFEMDLPGGDFSNPVLTRTFSGARNISFTGSEINKLLYDNGISFGNSFNMQSRVISSYANNNDKNVSSILAVKMSPYAKLPSPSTGTLFIIGDAVGGWSQPVPVPAQQFTKIDDKHYTGTFNLLGKKEFLILPQNTSYDNKLSVADNTLPYLNDGGDFGYNLAQNFPGMDRDGKYKIDIDFNNGKFTVTQINAFTPPSALYIIGDATPDVNPWTNPVPANQQFTQTADPNVFEITIDLKAGSYLFLPENGSWAHKFGASNPPTPLKGTLFGDDASNVPAPDPGTYKITVDFNTGKFWLVKQ